jgi:hypothetical protein
VRYKYLALGLAAILGVALLSRIHGQPQPPRSADKSPATDWDQPADSRQPADVSLASDSQPTADSEPTSDGQQQKIDALNDAYKNGLMTREEYDAKLRALSGGAPAPGRVNITRRTRVVEIPDPAWGLIAARFEIPEDWSFDGILIRDEGCDLTPSLAWRITSPDGLYGAQFMPAFGSHWSTNLHTLDIYQRFHCKIMEPLSPEEFLQYMVPLVRPNPTLGPFEPTEDAEQFQQAIENYNRRSYAAFGSTPDTGGAVRSRIQYAYRGQTMEEIVDVHQQTFKTRTGLPRGPAYFNWATRADVKTMRAPKGQLDEVRRILGPMLAAAGNFTPEENQRFTQQLQNDSALARAALQRQADATRDMLQRNADAFRVAQDRNHAIFMQGQQDRFNVGQEQFAAHREAMDRSALAYTLYAGDNQLVRNPQTGAVSTVTNKYGTSAWQENGTNNILLQNPNDVNPNLYLRSTYTQLENVDPMKY